MPSPVTTPTEPSARRGVDGRGEETKMRKSSIFSHEVVLVELL